MNNFPHIAIFCLVFLISVRADDIILPPQAPFFHLPERGAWEIEVAIEQPSTMPAQPGPVLGRQLIRIESIKTGEVKHDFFYYSDGYKEEMWYCGKYRLIGSLDHHDAVVIDPHQYGESGTEVGLVYSSGLPGVDWISKKDYQKPMQQGSSLCYFFERKVGETVVGQAWIDVHTGLPVSIQVGLLKYLFKFKSPPADSLTLPSPYSEAWQRFDQLEARRRLVTPNDR